MKRLFILLAVCAAVFADKLIQNEIEFSNEFDFLKSDSFAEENISDGMLKNLVNKILKPMKNSDLNEVLLQALNVTKFNEALAGDHPHAHMKVIEIIQRYEYKTEVHKVETKDGYILELHRITGNKTKSSPDGKPAVFLMHGILASSSDWVLTGPERGLAFILADAGYDVWMGNNRGNRYSREHSNSKIKKKAYWKFTWHEIGIYDLPAMIDYVLEATQHEKITYVGHSQGSTAFLVMQSERPEYNDKINLMFSLAPVAYCSHMYSPFLRYLAPLEKYLRAVYTVAGPWEVLPNEGLYKIITQAICKGPLQKLCSNAIFILSGFNEEQFDMELLPAITAHLPAGASVFQLAHYAQLIKSGHFRQFDSKLIGSSNPPYYNLQRVRVPISLHYANNDWLSDGDDVEILRSKLPNVINTKMVPNQLFNHIDFLYAKDVKALLYDEILVTMNKYNNL